MSDNKIPNSIVGIIKFLEGKNLSEDNYQKELTRFIEAKARKYGIPITGTFELTPYCNLDCKMCYVHLNSAQFEKAQLLPVQTWLNIIKQSREAGMVHATLTGGECLTYPGFDEIYLYLYNMGIKPSVLTNGVLIDQKRISFFKQYPPRIIQITLYGSSEDAYERVTGHRVFHTVIHNLRMLRDAEIPVKISITPNKYMEKEVRSLFETIEEFGFEYTINANLVLPRENTGRDLQDLPIDRYVEIYKISAEMKKNITLSPIDPNELPDDINVSNKKYGLVCGAGRSMFGITYEGKLIPCISLHEISADPIKCGFKNAWKQVNEIVEKYPFPEECGDCVYFKRCLNCVAMHKNAPQKGHCDRRICERTKRLICEGFIPLP